MTKIVLGLDIGGANLKAATSSGRARSVPFAVWKQPDKLSAEIRKLIEQFPEATELAVTTTAELCDCYETKREGVRRIVEDVQAASKLPLRIWSTDGKFVSAEEAIAVPIKVAAANWHALATFAGRFTEGSDALLVDIGSTTTDIIPLSMGRPNAAGATDPDRLAYGELIYTGWRRTPATTLLGPMFAAEFFATTHDAYLVLGLVEECADDRDTADGRPATKQFAKARLSRMACGDVETIDEAHILAIATKMMTVQKALLDDAINLQATLHLADRLVLSGSGWFLLQEWLSTFPRSMNLNELLGAELSGSAPAYAVAMLA